MHDGNEYLDFEKIESITFNNGRISIWGDRIIVGAWYQKPKLVRCKVTILCPDQNFEKGFKDKRGNLFKLKSSKAK